MHYLLSLVLLVLSAKSAFSANILYIAAVASPSHHIWNRALAVGLANHGHNVTYISADEDKLTKPKNYTSILLEGVYGELHEAIDVNGLANMGPYDMLFEFRHYCETQCELMLKSKGLQTLLDYPSDFKFDLIIIDITAGGCLYPLIHMYNYPPTVAVSAFLLPIYLSNSFGNGLYPSYIPWYGLKYTSQMNFLERVWNYLYTHLDIHYRIPTQAHNERELSKKVFGENIPPFGEIERHMSLALANTDPVLDYPQPIPPNIIPVGGLHTRRGKEIPKEWLTILDNAKNGVILFSLGTNIRSDKLPIEIQKEILKALAQLSETVIWKFESSLDDIPKNVIISKWLPQNDILGHPNVKLFIGHGGALSTQETFYHGVPVVLIPFIVDQYINSKIVVDKKLGVQVDVGKITADYFLRKIREVLGNPMYKDNVKKLSEVYKDRLESPLERGIFWIEYVLRHGGAHFLNTAGRDLPFYKRASLDVIAFLAGIAYVIISVIIKLIVFVLKLSTKSKKVKLQ